MCIQPGHLHVLHVGLYVSVHADTAIPDDVQQFTGLAMVRTQSDVPKNRCEGLSAIPFISM